VCTFCSLLFLYTYINNSGIEFRNQIFIADVRDWPGYIFAFDVDEYKQSDSSRDRRETSGEKKENTGVTAHRRPSQDRNERRGERKKRTSPVGLMHLYLLLSVLESQF
jgi:hypothetical protein